MMKALYNEKGAQLRIDILAEQPAQDFINAHADALDTSFQQVHMSDAMRQRLQRSNYIFSGFKTFHELNEATHALIDENGNRKPFEQFLNDVQKIDQTYNSNYLRAEYNFVHASATMAAKWEEFMQDGDRYNLQYRTARDNRVRPEHAALHGVTLPITDTFWQEYYPPNGWNCRCTVVQVRKSKYPVTPHDEAMALGDEATGKDTKGIFHFNPGIEQKTFPDYNPYTIRRCRDCDLAKLRVPDGSPVGNKLAFIPDNEVCQACTIIRQIRGQETERRLNADEKRRLRNATMQWCDRHLEIGTNDRGQTVKRLILSHKRMQNGIILDRNFFEETFAKNNRNRLLAKTMDIALKTPEWLPGAEYVRTEAGIHHPYPFDVYEATIDGVDVECKVAMKFSGASIFMMRIKRN